MRLPDCTSLRCWLTVWALALTCAAASRPAAASDESMHRVRIEVTHIEGTEMSGLTAHTTWLGRQRSATLVDDGTAPDLEARDEIWTAEWVGSPVRMLPVRLVAECGQGAGAETRDVYAALELIPAGDTVLSYAINRDCDAPAIRIPTGQDQPLEADHRLLVGHMLWVVFGFLLVIWGATRPRSPVPEQAPKSVWPWLFVWVILAVLWTWPAAIAGPNHWVGRHFDLPGTIWSLSAIPRIGWQLVDPLTGWPRGADYSRFDSYTLIPLGHLLQFLHPARLHGWLQIGGVALSAWAAQGFARALGARAPWDLIAGLSFAFSGVASTVLLEGHVYVLFNPWMPLFAWTWWVAMTHRQTAMQGVLAGVCFCLAALTTAYLGLAAAVIAVGFFIGGLALHGMQVLRPGLTALATVLPVGVALAWVTASGDPTIHDTTIASIQLGSANLLNLLGPVPQIDFDGHSIAPTISPIVIGLMLAAPIVLTDWRRYRMIWWTGLAALLLSFGMSIDADGNSPLLPLPLFWVLEAFESRWYRFPVRMFWGWALCGGVLGAVALTRMARGSRAIAMLVLLGALGHSFLAIRHTDRQRLHIAQAPSAYTMVDGPVLDLFPEGSDLAREEEMWFSALACGYQVEHHRPLAENCVSTVPQDNPRNVLGRVVRAQLLAGQVEFVRELLASIGFAAIALHVDLFTPGDADRISTALLGFGAPIADTTDGGEHILLVPVPGDLETQGLFRSQRVAIFDAADDSHFFTNFTIGAVLAGVAGEVPPDRELQVEVREEVIEAREVESWTATVAWDGQELPLKFVDPHEVVREEEDLEFRWIATWSGEIPSRFILTVTGNSRQGDVQTEWRGEVHSRAVADRVVFAYGPKGIRPIVPTAALNTPLRETDAGLLAAMFWGMFLFLMTWVWIVLRWRSRPAQDAAPEE